MIDRRQKYRSKKFLKNQKICKLFVRGAVIYLNHSKGKHLRQLKPKGGKTMITGFCILGGIAAFEVLLYLISP